MSYQLDVVHWQLISEGANEVNWLHYKECSMWHNPCPSGDCMQYGIAVYKNSLQLFQGTGSVSYPSMSTTNPCGVGWMCVGEKGVGGYSPLLSANVCASPGCFYDNSTGLSVSPRTAPSGGESCNQFTERHLTSSLLYCSHHLEEEGGTKCSITYST